MANTCWFSMFYSEIENIFNYLPNTDYERYFKVDFSQYSGELIFYINNLLESNKINYNKTEILAAVTKFVNRKVAPKKSARSYCYRS